MSISFTPSVHPSSSGQITVNLENNGSSVAAASSSTTSTAPPVTTLGSPPAVVVALSQVLKTSAESYKGLEISSQKLGLGLDDASDALDTIDDELTAIKNNATTAEDENNILSDYDRSFLQADTNTRLSKIDQLATSAEFNGSSVLDGSLAAATPLTVNLTLSDTGQTTIAIESTQSSDLLDGNTINLSTAANATTALGYIEGALAEFNSINGAVKETISSSGRSAEQLGSLAGSLGGTAERLETYVNPVDTAAAVIVDASEPVSAAVEAISQQSELGQVNSVLESIKIDPLKAKETTSETNEQTPTAADTSKVQSYGQSASNSSPTTPQKSVIDITA